MKTKPFSWDINLWIQVILVSLIYRFCSYLKLDFIFIFIFVIVILLCAFCLFIIILKYVYIVLLSFSCGLFRFCYFSTETKKVVETSWNKVV